MIKRKKAVKNLEFLLVSLLMLTSTLALAASALARPEPDAPPYPEEQERFDEPPPDSTAPKITVNVAESVDENTTVKAVVTVEDSAQWPFDSGVNPDSFKVKWRGKSGGSATVIVTPQETVAGVYTWDVHLDTGGVSKSSEDFALHVECRDRTGNQAKRDVSITVRNVADGSGGAAGGDTGHGDTDASDIPGWDTLTAAEQRLASKVAAAADRLNFRRDGKRYYVVIGGWRATDVPIPYNERNSNQETHQKCYDAYLTTLWIVYFDDAANIQNKDRVRRHFLYWDVYDGGVVGYADGDERWLVQSTGHGYPDLLEMPANWLTHVGPESKDYTE